MVPSSSVDLAILVSWGTQRGEETDPRQPAEGAFIRTGGLASPQCITISLESFGQEFFLSFVRLGASSRVHVSSLFHLVSVPSRRGCGPKSPPVTISIQQVIRTLPEDK
jgi:hypothetical protein